MAEKGGEYQLCITEDTLTYGEKSETILLADKKLQLYCSEHVYTIKIEREVFAVPKRILTEDQGKRLERIAAIHKGSLTNVVIKKE